MMSVAAPPPMATVVPLIWAAAPGKQDNDKPVATVTAGINPSPVLLVQLVLANVLRLLRLPFSDGGRRLSRLASASASDCVLSGDGVPTRLPLP